MNRLLKKSVKLFITPSPLLEHYLRLNYFGTTIYLPPFRKKTGIVTFDKMQSNHFLYVGQLETQKGVEILIREFALAHKENPELTLKIAGTGAEENYLKQKVKNLNLENNIQFLGWINPETEYQQATALIFPSIGLESFGLVITEAMSHGRAVIGSNRGPTAWLIDDKETGLLFDPLIQGELAKKILQLSANRQQAETYGKNSLEKLNTFLTDQDILEKIISLYQSIRNGKST